MLTRFRHSVILLILSLLSISWTHMGTESGRSSDVPSARFDFLPVPATIGDYEIDQWVNGQMRSMTLEEKIGQLLLIDYDMRGLSGIRSPSQGVEEYHVGGFLVRRSMDMDQLPGDLSRLQRLSKVPLFIAADFERGAGRHNNDLTQLPSTMALGATRNPRLAEQAGMVTAVESRSVGVNLVFAPVVDVNNNPQNPIINTRAYGENPKLVAEMAEAWVRGAERYGLLTTLKHFPGHGNTSVDSHTNLGVVEGDRASLDNIELYPYHQLLKSDVPPSLVMTAHLSVPGLDATDTPATFSKPILEGILRNEMNFDGIIITDGINMGAITRNYTFEESIIRPIEAGADIVLLPRNPKAAIEAIQTALSTGRISEQRIDASVDRILRAKARIGLHREQRDSRQVSRLSIRDLELGFPGEEVARAIAEQSLTLLQNDGLPLNEGESVALVQLTHLRSSSEVSAAMDRVSDGLSENLGVKEFRGWANTRISTRQIQSAVESADAVVLTMYLKVTEGRGHVGLSARQENLVRSILRENRKVFLIAFGNPYSVEPLRAAETVMVSYDQTTASADAVVDRLMGRIQAEGQLPVSVGPYAFGSGLEGTGGPETITWEGLPEEKQLRRDF